MFDEEESNLIYEYVEEVDVSGMKTCACTIHPLKQKQEKRGQGTINQLHLH